MMSSEQHEMIAKSLPSLLAVVNMCTHHIRGNSKPLVHSFTDYSEDNPRKWL